MTSVISFKFSSTGKGEKRENQMMDQVQVAYQFVLKHLAAPKPENHGSKSHVQPCHR